MPLKEKILFSTDEKRIILYKEGLFYKCFNEEAMLFVKKVREYKVNNKIVKSTWSNVFSIGFPASEIEKGKLSFEESKDFGFRDQIQRASVSVMNNIAEGFGKMIFLTAIIQSAKFGPNQRSIS